MIIKTNNHAVKGNVDIFALIYKGIWHILAVVI